MTGNRQSPGASRARTLWLPLILGAWAAIAGCEAPGVGDPCSPEAVPEGGFVATESYLETSSVQCRTRVCAVYQLNGVPNFIGPDINGDGAPDQTCDPTTEACADVAETEQRVYCTCRCDAPSDVGQASLCDCPDGFSCLEVSTQGGPGVRGSYCIRSSTISET